MFNLTVTNLSSTPVQNYQFYEVVPQGSTYAGISDDASTDWAPGTAAGTLCTITETNPIVYGTPQVVKITFTTVNPLPETITRIFNVATQGITAPPPGCSASGAVCETPPTTCPTGASCAEIPTVNEPSPRTVTPVPVGPWWLIALLLGGVGALGQRWRVRRGQHHG